MAIRLGTAPDSWGVWFPEHVAQPPWQRFLDEVVEAGFEAIELGPLGYLPTDPTRLADELGRRGLQLASGFLFGDLAASGAWSLLREETARLCDLLAAFGADRLVLITAMYTDLFSGQVVAPATLDADGWQRLAEVCQRIGDYSQSRGIRSVFHPHAETPVEHEDQIERLLDLTDPALVGLCLDTGHHAYRGGDAVAFARAHADRIGHIHLKNVDPLVAGEVTRTGTPFAVAVQRGVFCDLDQGAVDVPALFEALHEAGYDGWAIVEQDVFPTPFERPLPIARRNRDFLRGIGAG